MNSSTSSGGEKPDNVPARKRQNRQAVLGMLKKVDIKNKGLKRFFYFTYEADPSAAKQEQVKKLYFSNGEICEGDEYFLQHMKKSVFVSNIPGGTKSPSCTSCSSATGWCCRLSCEPAAVGT